MLGALIVGLYGKNRIVSQYLHVGMVTLSLMQGDL